MHLLTAFVENIFPKNIFCNTIAIVIKSKQRGYFMEKIGIIGGAGPMASAMLFEKIIKICQRSGCKDDADFPEIVLLSIPFKEMVQSTANRVAVAKQLHDALTVLDRYPVDHIGIACNTLHLFLDAEKKYLKLVDILALVKKYLHNHKLFCPLILASRTAITHNIHGCKALYFEQSVIDAVIDAILKGDVTKEIATTINAVIKTALARYPEIDSIVLGCTELPLILDKYHLECHGRICIDTLDLLAEALCTKVFATAI